MHPILQAIFDQQRGRDFADFAGTDVAATIPVADRWLNDQIARSLPPDGVVRELQLRSLPGNHVAVHVRVAKGAIALPIDLVLAIDSQPELPHRPILGLRLEEAPIFLTLGGPLLKVFNVLPPGITMNGDHVTVDIARLLASYQMSEALRYVSALGVTTEGGALVLQLRAQIVQPTRANSTSHA